MSDHEKRISHKKATAKLSLQKRSKEDVKMQVKEVLEGGAGGVNLNETLEFKKCVKKDAEIKGIGGELRDKFSYSKRFAHSSNRISEENTDNEPLVLPGEGTAGSGQDMDDQTTFCQICHKDLSHMNSQRKSQHVNKCVDKMEQEQKGEEQRQRLLEKAKTAVLDCPFCGKPFKSETSRSSHLKKCAAEVGVSTDKMLLLVKKQEEERQKAVAAGIIPNISKSLRQKQPSSSESSVSRKKRIKEPRSQFDEDVQMAMAISSSLAEVKQLLDSDQISITGSTSSSSTRETKKSRQKKQEEGEPLLLALSEEEKKKRLSNRVTILILSQSSQEKEKFDCTTVLKESNLGRKKIKIENQSGSDDQESKEVPGLWTRSILSEKDTANKAVFYVRSLMPPIEISKASAGSRLRHLPKSPGKCRSVDQDKGARELDSSAEPPHAVTKADYDTTSETIIASTQTAVILAELAGDDDGGRNQKDEEESKMSQNSQHNIESSKWIHDHIKKNDETEKFNDSELLHASGFCPEDMVVPKEDDALVLQQRLRTDLLRLVNNPGYSDMIIVTKDKQRLHAHRLLLMARCPALLQMCVDGTVLLEESSEETVLALLTYLYSGQLNLPLHILPQLVTLAKRLDLHELMMVCNQMEVLQHTKNTEGDEGDDSNEYRSQGLKDVWGESNSDSEDRNSEMSSVEEHPDKGKHYVIDSRASSISASPVAFRTSCIQTPEKELDISSDLFSSPKPMKDNKEKSKEFSPFRNNSINERKISTPVRDMDTDVRKVEMNQNIYEMSPFVDSGSKNRKIETYGADKTPKRAASDKNPFLSKWSKKDIFSSEEEDFNYAKLKIAEQNDGDIEIVGDNFSEMCAQSPTFNDRWKSKWISKDQISDVSISSKQDHFIGKLSDDPDIDTDIKSLELEESVRVMEDSRLVKDNEMVKFAIPSCEGQIVDIKDCPSMSMPTENSAITTNSSQKAAGSVQPVLDEHLSVLADPNVWDDFDDCGAGFGEGIVFTPLKSAFQNSDAMCSQTQSTRKSSFSDDIKVLQHGKTQLTNDNNKNNLTDRGSNTDSDLKGDNLEDSLMNKEEDETAFAEDSFIWMVENMPVDESNPEMKEEKSSSDEQYQKAVNFKTPEAASREMKSRKEWIPPSPFTPMPNYANMPTPMLKKEIDRYGVKPLSKKKMLLMLQEIYHKTHQYETDSEVDVDDTDISASQEENCPSSSQESEISEVIEESFMEEKCTENDVPSSPQKHGENLTQMMMKFIQDHPEIHIRMLMYEPLELDWLKKQMLDAGLKCSVDKLMNFLDEKCITFTMKNQRKDSRRGRGKKRRAKTSKDSS